MKGHAQPPWGGGAGPPVSWGPELFLTSRQNEQPSRIFPQNDVTIQSSPPRQTRAVLSAPTPKNKKKKHKTKTFLLPPSTSKDVERPIKKALRRPAMALGRPGRPPQRPRRLPGPISAPVSVRRRHTDVRWDARIGPAACSDPAIITGQLTVSRRANVRTSR